MHSTVALNVMIVVLVGTVHGIQSSTGSTTSDQSSGPVSGNFQVQHLINQESMLRLTLDKQLQDLRSMVFDLKSKLEQSNNMVNELKSTFERSDEGCNSRIRSLEMKMSNITETVNERSDAISSQILEKFTSLDDVILDRQSNLTSIQGRTEETRRTMSVYFSATLSSTYTTTQSHDVIKFNHVYVNKGNAYNPNTGTFTCPINGTYLFSFSFTSIYASRVHGRIVVNGGKTLLYALALEDNEYNTGVGTVLYPLKKGDRVQVIINERGATIYGYPAYSTFSGMLISEE